jgi:hypothetical protein
MQTLKINVEKIDKTALYNGAKGSYLTLNLKENKDGTDQYGNDGFIIQDIGKDRRLAGEKGPIIGNWKRAAGFAPKEPTNFMPSVDSDDEIPF